MPWKKASQERIDIFDRIVPEDGRVERRKMFGYPCAFASGSMFMGLHQDDIVLRLPEDARRELLSLPGASVFEPMPGRPMREYIVLPEALLQDGPALEPWIERSLQYTAALPAKAPRARKPRRPRSG